MDPKEQEIRETADAIYREKVWRARRLPPQVKMGMGGSLFAEVCGRMRSGIRHQFPGSSEAEVDAILRTRLERLAKVREAGGLVPTTKP